VKRLALLVLIGMSVGCWGQTTFMPHPQTFTLVANDGFACEDSITFKGHAKKVKDLFPEECPDLSAVKPMCSWAATGTTGHVVGKCDIPDIAAMDDIRGSWREASEPEPDVPAIKVITPAAGHCNLPGVSPTDCITGPEEHLTCEDPARLLLRSEDGKAHCIRLGKEK
jgi:hypothetical protein